MKDIIIGIIKAVVIVLITISLAIGLGVYIGTSQMEEDTKNFNNGICAECGGQYIFSSMEKSHPNSETIYSYTCGECGHTILTHHIMK